MLFAAAQGKQLRTRDQVLAQARRLLESPAGKATVRDLHDQMIKDVDPTELVRDTSGTPSFKPDIGADMKEEALTFVNEVIFGQGKAVSELLTANCVDVNAKLAPLYGVQVPAGTNDKFVKVTLDRPAARRSLHPARLPVGDRHRLQPPAHQARRAPQRAPAVQRGAAAAARGEPDPDPQRPRQDQPADVRGGHRGPGQRLRGLPRHPHQPAGLRLRELRRPGPLPHRGERRCPSTRPARYEFAEGDQEFNGAVELMKIIAEGRQAHDCYAQHLFEYVYGRSATDVDGALVTELGRRSQLKVPVKDIMLDLVATDAFLNRVP